jgi:hypothetical protein
VNLGNPHEFTIQELAALTAELCGTPSSVRYCPLPQDDPAQRRPDISRAERLLDWSPKVELREGLLRTIANFRGRLGKSEEQGSRQRAISRRALLQNNGKADKLEVSLAGHFADPAESGGEPTVDLGVSSG